MLEVVIQKRRDTKAAKRFIRKLLSDQGTVPRDHFSSAIHRELRQNANTDWRDITGLQSAQAPHHYQYTAERILRLRCLDGKAELCMFSFSQEMLSDFECLRRRLVVIPHVKVMPRLPAPG